MHPALPNTAIILALTAPEALAADYPTSDPLLANWETRDAWKGHGIPSWFCRKARNGRAGPQNDDLGYPANE